MIAARKKSQVCLAVGRKKCSGAIVVERAGASECCSASRDKKGYVISTDWPPITGIPVIRTRGGEIFCRLRIVSHEVAKSKE